MLEIIKHGIDFVLHIDSYLNMIIQTYGWGSYALLFFIIFIETGLVVTPFLPGDSLIFAAGAFAALGSFSAPLLLILLILAAVLGNTVNYFIGRSIGQKVYRMENSRLLKKKYLDETQAFYEKHGGKTIIITRFIPIIRTFAPFVAGVGKMNFGKFLAYNIIGGSAWVGFFTFLGFYFGNLPVVKNNFTFVIMAIIVVSVMPAVIGIFKQKLK